MNSKIKSYLKTLNENDQYWYQDKTKKFVLLFEKPSQIKATKSVLNSLLATTKYNHIKFMSLAGHIMRLKSIEEYDTTLKDMTWFELVKQNKIPFFPEKFELVIKEKATGKFRTDYQSIYLNAKRAFDEADYVLLLTDPDTEGCALGMEVINEAKAQDKLLGMVNMSKLDFFSLKDEIKYLDKIPYYTMAEAGFARSEFDWVFGINHTILSSVLLGEGETLHIGGVKSPVMKMVVEREKEIETFEPEPYWNFNGELKHLNTDEQLKYDVFINVDRTLIKEAKTLEKQVEEKENIIEKLKNELSNINEEEPEFITIKEKINEEYKELSKIRWNLREIENEIKDKEKNIFSKKLRDDILKLVKRGNKFKISKITKKYDLIQSAPLAYSLTDLQAEANMLHKFTPAKTLELAQKLYEKQFQSYPRTDNRYYSNGEMANINKIIPELLKITEFQNFNLNQPYKAKTGVFNSARVTAHTGLAPTAKVPTSKNITDEEWKIYTMVAKRYLLQFVDKFVYDRIEIEIEVNDKIKLVLVENIVKNKGWREYYNPRYGLPYNEVSILDKMQENDEIEIISLNKENLQTKPRPRFSEFSLLKGMENISRIYKDLGGLEKGIGTPATRAQIISQLFKNKYLLKTRGQIIPSKKTTKIIELLPDKMTSPKLRADLEYDLNLIIENKLTREQFREKLKKIIFEQAEEIKRVNKENNLEIIDKTTLPPTEAQLKFAKSIADELNIKIPKEAIELKSMMAKWIKKYESKINVKLSEKQYNFLKNYGMDRDDVKELLESHDKNTLTKDQKFKAGKILGEIMRSSEYHKLRAKKAAETRRKNREAKLKALEKMGNKVGEKINRKKRK
jgi:DNA topoisomerase IA